jgi:hypothetical protein
MVWVFADGASGMDEEELPDTTESRRDCLRVIILLAGFTSFSFIKCAIMLSSSDCIW